MFVEIGTSRSEPLELDAVDALVHGLEARELGYRFVDDEHVDAQRARRRR